MKKVLFLSLCFLSFQLYTNTALACALCGDTEAKSENATKDSVNSNEVLESIKNSNTVVLAFHSKSCSSCKAQKPELESILSESSYKSTKKYFLNFETSSELRKTLGVKFPSTVIVFKKGSEIVRSTGETDRNKLISLVQKGL